jgi:membrane-associated phospholipid phosphatase
MPSLHVGMAPVVAWALVRLSPWLWTKVLGVVYPLLVATSIVVTGNHWILDIAGGLAVVLPAAALGAWLARTPRSERPAPRPAPQPGG